MDYEEPVRIVTRGAGGMTADEDVAFNRSPDGPGWGLLVRLMRRFAAEASTTGRPCGK